MHSSLGKTEGWDTKHRVATARGGQQCTAAWVENGGMGLETPGSNSQERTAMNSGLGCKRKDGTRDTG